MQCAVMIVYGKQRERVWKLSDLPYRDKICVVAQFRERLK